MRVLVLVVVIGIVIVLVSVLVLVLFNRFAHSAGPGHEYVRSVPGGPGCRLAVPKTSKIQVPRHQNRGLEASWGVL